MEGEVQVSLSTGYSKSQAYINDIKKGERIVVVDDVSTGGTIEQPETLEQMGAILHAVIVAIEKGDGKSRLSKEKPNWPIMTLARIEIIDGKAIIR